MEHVSIHLENLNLIEIIMEINIIERDRERKRMEARVFEWFGYVSLHPQDVVQWATSLLYFLFDIFG